MKEEWYKHPNNLVEMFEISAKKYANRNCIATKNSEGVYEWITYRELAARVDNLRGGLAQIDIGKGDTVGLIINNSVEWAVIAFATYGLNARLVPMYEKELEKVWRYIVEDGDVKVLFVVNDDVYEKIKGYKDEISTLQNIYIIRSKAENSMKSLEELGAKNPTPSVKPHWSDIAGLIYTSGTTGDPKGVLLSHGNFTSNVHASKVSYPDITPNDVSFSILPWAHSFGQTCELYFNLSSGESCGLMDTTETLTIDLPKIRPTILIAVPRIFNKIYQGIYFKMKQEGPKKEKLFQDALKTAEALRTGEKAGFKNKLISKVVFKKVRELFGGRLRYAITGSAVMNPEIAQFFIDVGIPTYDGYGMTETSPVITANCPAANKLGSVGKPIENITVVIDKSLVGEDSEDGEIICYGPNVMQGYYKKPEKTKEVIVEDPKLGKGVRTGDRGRIDEDGFLFITGRFKEEFKLENGKYVHPASIEEELKLNNFIANAMIYGDGKTHTVCILVPDFQILPMFTKQAGITETNPQELIKNPKIKQFLSGQAEEQLKGTFGGYEIPREFLIIAEDFTIENGMLTQTMKLKRRNVLKNYGAELEALYK